MSPDAAKILTLPAAMYPALKPLAMKLADHPAVTIGDALDILDVAASSAGITSLDIEMVQPGSTVAVPFAAAQTSGPETFTDRVRAHVIDMQGNQHALRR